MDMFHCQLKTMAFLSLIRFFSVSSFASRFVSRWTVKGSSRCMSMMSSDSFIQAPVKVLGVCGGIGSGKSAACQLLVSDLNCAAHLNADSLAHLVYQPGNPAAEEMVSAFGPGILLDNNEIDRRKLGTIVFSDESSMRKLEKIVWPRTRAEILSQIEQIATSWNEDNIDDTIPIVVVEAAVLLDAGWDDFLDALWVVRASPEVALARLKEHRGLDRELAESRIAAQQSRRGIGNISDEVASGVVSAVIENDGTLDDLRKALKDKLDDPSAWYKR